jgi:hypothetical protein
MSQSEVRYRFRRKLGVYLESHLPLPGKKNRQMNALLSSLDRTAVELLVQGVRQKELYRPELLLPQVQLTIEPHAQVLGTAFADDFLSKIF